MPPEPLHELRPADDDSRLRTPEQLVAREADEVGSGGERLPCGRLARQLDEHARAEIVHERKPVRVRDARELADARELGEADHAKVGLVHA